VAVYTDVAAEDLAAFLAGYDLGELLSYKGIAEGVENSNFLVHTSAGHFILTLYEKRVAAGDVPFFLALMEHLANHGIICPQPVKNRSGKALGQLAGRPAALVTFLDGMWIRRPGARHCAAVGGALAGRRAIDLALPRALGPMWGHEHPLPGERIPPPVWRDGERVEHVRHRVLLGGRAIHVSPIWDGSDLNRFGRVQSVQ